MSKQQVSTREDAPSTLVTLVDAVVAPDQPFGDDDRILITEKGLAALKAAEKEAQVVATGYSSTPDQTDSDPWITATGRRVRPGTVAISRDLLRMLPHGTTLWIIDDTMGPAARNGLDVWFPDRATAVRWGKRTLTLEIRP